MSTASISSSLIGAPPRMRLRVTWLAGVAIVVIALLAIPFLRRWRDPIRRLAALTPRSERIVEARISGGFAWAPYRGPARASSEQASDPRRMMLGGVAGDLIEAAETNKTSDAQHLAGVARMLTGFPSDAVPVLQEAAQRDPSNATAWNDLAAAQYAAASRDGRASLYPEALASSDRALQLDSRLPEALFNHALVLERLGLTQQAHEAWQRYLAADPSSQWAEEARARLSRLPLNTAATLFQRDLPRLEHGDATVVDSMVKRYPQQTRAWAEADLLGQWGEVLMRGDMAAADRKLSVARNIGDGLLRASGERLLHDAVAAIDNAGAARARLAAAHIAYRRGRITYSHRQPAAAEPDLRQAAAGFAAGGSPMSMVSRYFAANTRFDQNDVAGAHSELEGLLPEADAIPGYQALGAQIRWELAVCRTAENDWDGVPPIAAQAAAAFGRLGERRNLAIMQTIGADALVLLGRLDEAWQARISAFEAEGEEGNTYWLAVSVGTSARMELRAGRMSPARALLHIEQEIDRAGGHHELLCASLVREAILSADDGNDVDAERLVREARAIAASIADPAIRARLAADVQFAEGVATLQQQPRRAIASLNAAIAHYAATDRVLFLPECYLARARAAQRLGDSAGAERDLESGISMLERQPVQLASSISGPVIRDAGPAMFREAIRLYLDRGDVFRAFSYAERSHMTLPGGDGKKVTLSELQRHLAGTSTAVLEIVVLADEVAVFCVTAGGSVVGHAPVAQHQLEALVGRIADVRDEKAARELFELLIRPVESALARVNRIIVVADLLLENVPFAALYDEKTHAYLIERLAVIRAVSASSLRDDVALRVPRSVAAIALPPSTAMALAALPAAGQELAEVSQSYARATRIAGADATVSAVVQAAAGADVIHIAGHTEREPGIGEAALVFAGGHRMSWRTIAASRLASRPVVVLAACETLRVPQSAQTFAMSLGGGFLAAGARDVVGTLTPVADNDARQLFRQIHRHLASGLDVASAVRQAQLEALSDPQHQTAWRVVTLLTTHISRSGG